MLVALLLSLVTWTHPLPHIWLCGPGIDPNTSAIIECQPLHYQVLAKVWVP